jgi:H(+)-translocating pyrophosphatase
LNGISDAFDIAYRGGTVLGFTLSGIGIFSLLLLLIVYQVFYFPRETNFYMYLDMFEAVAGFGMGASAMALFQRVGGGIFTKAADIGSDLVGKVVAGIEEDSPMNPGVIADNVGDNVGCIAGIGADIFGSFAESSCAALIIGATSEELVFSQNAFYFFPLMVSSTGLIVSIFTSFCALTCMKPVTPEGLDRTLKWHLIISTIIMTPAIYILAYTSLPTIFHFTTVNLPVPCTWKDGMYCTILGLWAGMLTGYMANYYTSNLHQPVQEVARSTMNGPATTVISGLSLGFKSTMIPVCTLALTVYISYYLCHLYGVSLAAIGLLSTMATSLSIDGFGPIADNAGGIARMCGLEDGSRVADAIDAAGNTSGAICKGYAICSACLSAIALFGAFTTRCKIQDVNILNPLQFGGLLVGAMIPYLFTSMTLQSVN